MPNPPATPPQIRYRGLVPKALCQTPRPPPLRSDTEALCQTPPPPPLRSDTEALCQTPPPPPLRSDTEALCQTPPPPPLRSDTEALCQTPPPPPLRSDTEALCQTPPPTPPQIRYRGLVPNPPATPPQIRYRGLVPNPPATPPQIRYRGLVPNPPAHPPSDQIPRPCAKPPRHPPSDQIPRPCAKPPRHPPSDQIPRPCAKPPRPPPLSSKTLPWRRIVTAPIADPLSTGTGLHLPQSTWMWRFAQDQGGQCKSCLAPIKKDWKVVHGREYRGHFCHYTGCYYCLSCHKGSTAPIPALVCAMLSLFVLCVCAGGGGMAVWDGNRTAISAHYCCVKRMCTWLLVLGVVLKVCLSVCARARVCVRTMVDQGHASRAVTMKTENSDGCISEPPKAPNEPHMLLSGTAASLLNLQLLNRRNPPCLWSSFSAATANPHALAHGSLFEQSTCKEHRALLSSVLGTWMKWWFWCDSAPVVE